MKTLQKSLTILALLFSLTGIAAAQTFYSVEDLGNLPGDNESVPWGINSFNEVVGWSNGPNGYRAFLFTDQDGMVELPPLVPGVPGDVTIARDINDFGQVTGRSNGHAVRWNILAPQDLGTLEGGQSEGLAINFFGDVVGKSSAGGGFGGTDAFVYTNAGGMVKIASGVASDINDAGQVAGWQGGSAFRWQGGVLTDLGVLPGFSFTTAYGINDVGQVVGNAINATLTTQHVYRFTDGIGFEDLGGEGDENLLYRINNLGQSVGEGRPLSGPVRGMIHSDAGGLQALNDLITSPGTWWVSFATDINDSGVIAALALNHILGEYHAVRLVPTSDPSCPSNCILSSAINLRATVKRGNVTAKAKVVVVDENGKSLSGVMVRITWTRPNGTTTTQYATTNRKGNASFSTSDGLGTYTLTVDNLSLDGFTFDRWNSVISESITR